MHLYVYESWTGFNLAETLFTGVIEALIISEKRDKLGNLGKDFLVGWREASKVCLQSLKAAWYANIFLKEAAQ